MDQARSSAFCISAIVALRESLRLPVWLASYLSRIFLTGSESLTLRFISRNRQIFKKVKASKIAAGSGNVTTMDSSAAKNKSITL